jgi:SAM-dependent methyltransferase
MFGWLKAGASGPATWLAMVGPRAADAVLVLGAREPSIAAEIGAVTRLNGRTVVVDQGAGAAAATERAGEIAGALLEFVAAPAEALPFDTATFHIVVAPELADWPAEQRAPRLAEAVRVLQPGGRVVVMVGGPGRGPFGKFARRPSLDTDTVLGLLTRSGLLAGRRLAETAGFTFYEARKARD